LFDCTTVDPATHKAFVSDCHKTMTTPKGGKRLVISAVAED